MINRLALATSFMLAWISQYSQTVRGRVNDTTGTGFPFASIALINEKDSAIVKGGISDDNGNYELSNVRPGRYRVLASAVGFRKGYSNSFHADSATTVTAPPISLLPGGSALKEISVSAVRNPIEFKGGNIIVNVAESPLAVGNSAYDLFNRLPGVMIDNDNISVNGQGGVRVYIDDRPQQMSGSQLVNFLRSLNSSLIEKIEVINNPPAKYDAAGRGAVINIVTKKVKITGFSGNINNSYSHGYFGTNNAGVSLNYKGNKFNLFSNCSFYEGRVKNETWFDRKFQTDAGAIDFNEYSAEHKTENFLTANISGDWYLNKRNTVGFKTHFFPGQWRIATPGTIVNTDPGVPYHELSLSNNNYNWWFYGNYDLNYEHKFDTAGTKVTVMCDLYSPYIDYYGYVYNTRYLNGGTDVLPPNNFRNENTIALRIFSAKADFEMPVDKTTTFSAGVKNAWQQIDSDYRLQVMNASGTYVVDSSFTNVFAYQEQITGAYANIEKQWKKVNGHIGLRGENTDVNTNSITSGLRYKRQYFQLFPVFSVNYNPSKNHILSIAGNTRVDRPDYNSFNPYRTFQNLFSSNEGNPYLLPSYDYNFTVNYIFREKYSSMLLLSYAARPMLGYPMQDDSTKQTVTRIQNVDALTHLRYVFHTRQNIRKWWTTGINVGVYYIDMKGDLGGASFFHSEIPWWVWNNQQFILPRNWKIELSAFYWSPWLGGVSRMEERWGVDLALKKSFMDKKLNFTLAFNDIFFSKQFTSRTIFRNQNSTRINANDTRRIAFSVSYDFGKVKAEQRQLQAPEEGGRTGR